jgi:polyisoprenyl-phosphate glycosyltransferase
MTRPLLSIVIPVYNEQESIPELDRVFGSLLPSFEWLGDRWEVVFVDDGSTDESRALLLNLARTDKRYRLVLLSRNFGHQLAITAGIDHADGDVVVIMDADMQDPPSVIAEMYARHREGFDVVYGVRKERKGETWFKRATAAAFYRLIRSITGISIPLDAGDFRLMSRQVVLTLRALKEQHRFVRGMVAWVGFRQSAVYYSRDVRFAGTTKYPLRKMARFAIDGLTSFSIVPLRVATWLGILSATCAFGIGIWALTVRVLGLGTVPGWTTIMFAVALGSAAQLVMTGILGEYVGRIYEECKRRPLYVVQEELNLDKLNESSDR